MKNRFLLCTVLVTFAIVNLGFAATTVVIANSSVTDASLTKSQLTDIYTKKTTTWTDGAKIVPVTLSRGSEVQNDFLNKVMGMGVREYTSYWVEAVFTGSGTPPKAFNSETELVEFVEKTPGAIGFISAETPKGKTKTITIK